MSGQHGRPLRGIPSIGDIQSVLLQPTTAAPDAVIKPPLIMVPPPTPRSEPGFGRFGRLFPDLPAAVFGADTPTNIGGSIEALTALAATMLNVGDEGVPIDELEPDDENAAIPAGYTYFGQFIDHDLTFDTASSLDRVNDPLALQDYRTSRFDLDSVYGKGTADQPYLYRKADGYCSFHLGADKAPGGLPPRLDLPRNADDRALIGDPRNDENKIVSQIHALFLSLHNILIAQTPASDDRFLAVQQRVRWHYQWIVIHDFLGRLLDPKVWKQYFGTTSPTLRFYRKTASEYAFIPVEFTVAAYRFGHSMIRPSYALNNPVLRDIAGKHPRIPVFDIADDPLDSRGSLNGFCPLPGVWGIDWSFFLPDIDASTGTPKDKIPQPSYRIDTMLADPLHDLPEHHAETPDWKRSLPARNLVRGRALGLPSGQRVATAIHAPVLSDRQLWQEAGNLDAAPAKARADILGRFPQFAGNAPLWYYILREAELTQRDGVKGGVRLGAVGSTIIAETFAALMLFDPFSYLSVHPGFTPTLPRKGKTFTLSDLVNFVDANAGQAGPP